MKSTYKIFASLVTLFAAGLVQAADQPAVRATGILDVETSDPVAYANWMKQYNEIAKAKLNVDNYVRVYQSIYDGRTQGRVRAVTSASSVAELMKNAELLENDPGIRQIQAHLDGIRKRGGRVLYRTLHFEGATSRGAYNYNSLINVTDEAGYLAATAELRRLFDANGMKDTKIIVYRVVAGKTDHTHRVVISAPSRDRLGAMLDWSANNPQMQDWFAKAAKLRTVVMNNTSREITKY